MHTNNFIKNLLGFKDVIITKIHNTDNRIEIYLEMKKKPHTCHRCNSETRRVHDYRIQRVKHLPFFLKTYGSYYKKRRYRCNVCGKRFYENDKFHYIRHAMWAVEAVRKHVQKELSVKLRKYFKRSKKLILKRFDLLDEDSKLALQVMFSYNSDLAIAHTLKEKLLKITETASSSKEALTLLKEWIKFAQGSGLKEFERCANTYIRYFNEIVNSFDIPYTNACTEGFNNKIKVIKRNAFGFKNFDRFRNRILHCCN